MRVASYSLYLSALEHLFSVLAGLPNNAIDLFFDTDCISVCRMLKQPALEAWRCRLCVVINGPFSQSLTSTRATLPVWYTSSQIESSPLSSCLWCNHTCSCHLSKDNSPPFISSHKVLHPKMHSASLRSACVFISAVSCWGANDQSLCVPQTETLFTAPPSALADHSAWHLAHHCSDQLYDLKRRIRLPFWTTAPPNK